MAGEVQKKGGKKHRKYDRNRTKSACMARYRSQNRRDENKRRRMEKQLRKMSKPMTSKTFPGWEMREGYGLIRVP